MLLAGVRTSVIINIGTATIASTVGAKTLGSPIIVGLSGFNTAYVIQGALVVGLLANSQLDPTLCLLFIFGILTDRIHLNNTSRDPGRGSLIFPIEFYLISGRIIWPFLYLDTGTENGRKERIIRIDLNP